MEDQGLWENLKNVVVKILIPAVVGVGINIAVTSRKKTMSVFNIITSLIIGVGMAWLLSGVVLNNFSVIWQPPLIALVAISGEKIANWIIYKWNIDKLIESLIDWYRK